MKSPLSLLLLGFISASQVFGQGAQTPLEVENVDENLGDTATSPRLAVSISASFLQSEIFGIKLVNNHPTQAVLSISNNEPAPVQLRFVGGSLWTLPYGGQPVQNIRNLSTTQYNGDILPGQSESFTYSFTTEMHPTELQLQLAAIVSDEKGNYFTVPAFNETVSVVEAPMSIFDPKNIFLYLILASLFAGTAYFIYTTWFTTLFGAQKPTRAGKSSDRARGAKRAVPAEQSPVAAGDAAPVATGAKAYDESWIPQSHIQRPQAKRVRSGTPSGVKKNKPVA